MIFEGDGWSTVIKMKDNISIEDWPEYTGLIENADQTNGNINITLQNFKLHGNRMNSTFPVADYRLDGIRLEEVTDSIVRNLWILHTQGDSLRYRMCSNLTITDCRVEEAGHDAIEGSGSHDCTITNNTVIGPCNAAFRLYYGWNITFSNNIAGGTHGWYGFEIYAMGTGATKNIKIIGNIIYSKDEAGITLDAANPAPDRTRDILIQGNIIYNIKTYGYGIIISDDYVNTTISNNVLYNNIYGIFMGTPPYQEPKPISEDVFVKNNILLILYLQMFQFMTFI